MINAVHRTAAVLGQETTALMLTIGLLCFAVFVTVVLLRTRKTADRIETESRDEATALQADIDRLKALLLSEPQVLVSWAAASEEPDILGDAALIAPGAVPERVLAFGSWLEPAEAQRMEQAVDTLRSHGRGFVMTLTTRAGRPVEAEGRAIGGRAVLRLRDVSGIEQELLDLAARHDRLLSDVETMKTLLDLLPAPVARDDASRLIFVIRSCRAWFRHPADALTRGLELLQPARAELARARATGEAYTGRLPAIVPARAAYSR
jgi:hypothetical protein